MFNAGQKVICINDEGLDYLAHHFTQLPKKDSVYTVRDTFPGMGPDAKTEEFGVRLVEITGTIAPKNGLERGFNGERFAPVDPPMTDSLEEVLGFAAPAERPRELVPSGT